MQNHVKKNSQFFLYGFLICLFALDSITTYIGLTARHDVVELNPIVKYLIGVYGLPQAMIMIFLYKTGLLTLSIPWRHRPLVQTAWRFLLVVYLTVVLFSLSHVFHVL